MPKPFPGLTGNGCHAHISVWDAATGKTNMFFDNADENPACRNRAIPPLGGIMKHAELLSAITNPTVNSYKRINAPRTVSGARAPNTVTWTGNNRTHMVRVHQGGRFELRLPDGAANPYLLQAVIIAAGIDGIEHNAKRHDIDMYQLGHTVTMPEFPLNLLDAIRNFDTRRQERPRRRKFFGGLHQTQDVRMEFLRVALHAVGARPHVRYLMRPTRFTLRTQPLRSSRRLSGATPTGSALKVRSDHWSGRTPKKGTLTNLAAVAEIRAGGYFASRWLTPSCSSRV